MTVFYTGRGDKGKSEMGAKKIAKDDPLFDALGALDELNSWIGLCRAQCKGVKFKSLKNSLLNIQETLFIAQAELAMIGMKKSRSTYHVTRNKTQELEEEIKKIDTIVPQIKQFIIPGASELSAQLDVARSLARNVERAFVAFSKHQPLNPELLQYLNRLSSALFALARFCNFKLNKREEHPNYR